MLVLIAGHSQVREL